MADANLQQFEKRARRIERRHRRLSAGYRTVITRNGLIEARPLRRTGLRFPWKGVILALVALMGFKVFLYTQLGALTYNDRVGRLEAGTAVEQAGAWVMQADPLTLWLAGQIGKR